MATTRTKKPAAKRTPKPKVSKAEATTPKAPAKVFDTNIFVKFNGYGKDTAEEDFVFTEGDTLYIIGTDETPDNLLYNVIRAADVEKYTEEGEEAVEGAQVGGSEISEIKGTSLDRVREQYMPVKAVGRLADMLAENGDDAIEAARDLFGKVQENYFWLGGALAQVLREGKYLTENGGSYEGEEAFNDFCQEEFGFKASKARQLARVYTTFSQLEDFDPEKLQSIGWSIAAKIERYVTPENVDEVLEVAAGETQRTVDAVMKERFEAEAGKSPSGRQTSRGGPTIQKTTLKYTLEEDSAETVKLALDACMKQSGIESESLALERICSEWAQEHVTAKTTKNKIASKVAKAEKTRSGGAPKTVRTKKVAPATEDA